MKIPDNAIASKQGKMDTFYKVKSDNPAMVIKDVDMQKRVVTGLYNTYNYMDSDRDVLLMGAAAKSISERGVNSAASAKIKHALFHDLTRLPGKIQVLDEREVDIKGQMVKGIYFETKMSMTDDGTDTLVKYQEEIYDNHSIGFRYVQLEYIDMDSPDWGKSVDLLINPEEAAKYGYMYPVKEINLFEGSTVSFGANNLTPYLGIKSMDKGLILLKLQERMDRLTKQLTSGTVTDDSMKSFEIQILQIKQMMNELFVVEPFVKPTVSMQPGAGVNSTEKMVSFDDFIAKLTK